MPSNNDEKNIPTGEDQSFGPVIAIIIIVTLLIIGALYILKGVSPEISLSKIRKTPEDQVVKMFSNQDSSDDIDSIKKDLSATVIQAIDRDLSPIGNNK